MRTTIALILSLALPVAAAASGPAESTQHVYTFAVDLGADGRLDRLEPYGTASGTAGDALAAEIRDWVFAPDASARDGENTRTYLRVVVDEPALGGHRVVSATTGPALATMTAPQYPMRDQLAGKEGMVVLRLQVSADGSVRDADIHAATGSVTRAMAGAAATASRQWRFAPEQVAGQPVASTLLWPVCYLGPQSAPSTCNWTGPDDQRFSSKTVLPLDPKVTVSYAAAD